MKKFLIFIILILFTGLFIYADEEKAVKLNDSIRQKTIEFANCNIFVSKGETDDDENTKVAIEIENKDESNVVILFGHTYPEKELKKLSPSIRFDKKYPKTNRSLDTFKEGKNVLFIDPTNDKQKIIEGIQIKKDEKYSCHLPFYIAKYKSNKRNKMLILEREILELEIEVEVKPDMNFIRLENECNDLIDSIGKKTFCPNAKHKPSLEKQKSLYKERIDSLVSVIIGFRDKYYSQDKGYKRYDELKQKLDGIQFVEIDCGGPHTPPPPPKKCKYCNLSAQQIYHKLDDIYKKIYNSNNRKATKNSVMSDVNLLYNCSRHSGTWKKSNFESKIRERYKQICNF